MLNRIVVACLLSLAALPAFAADEFRSEYRLNMSEADFQKAHEKFIGQGLRLVDITVSESKGRPVIGAIWQRFEGMPKASAERTKAQLGRVFLKLDESGLRATADRMAKEGSLAEVIDAYSAGGQTWFAVSFAPPKEPGMQTVGAFLTQEQFGGMREEAQKHGQDFWRVDAYAEGDTLKMMPAFVPREPTEIEVEAFDRTISISAKTAGLYLSNMHPLSISVFESKGQTGWVAAWDEGPDRNFVLTDKGEDIAKAVADGSVVVDLDSHAEEDGSVYYYAVVQPLN